MNVFYLKSSNYCWVILSLIDKFPQFSLPMSYVSSGTNLTTIWRLMPQVVQSASFWELEVPCLLLFNHLILKSVPKLWYNRSFLNCIIFKASLFCLYLRKLSTTFFTRTQKKYTWKILSHFSSNFTNFWPRISRSNLS